MTQKLTYGVEVEVTSAPEDVEGAAVTMMLKEEDGMNVFGQTLYKHIQVDLTVEEACSMIMSLAKAVREATAGDPS